MSRAAAPRGDLLGRIAARAVGAVALVRPRLPGRFEPPGAPGEPPDVAPRARGGAPPQDAPVAATSTIPPQQPDPGSALVVAGRAAPTAAPHTVQPAPVGEWNATLWPDPGEVALRVALEARGRVPTRPAGPEPKRLAPVAQADRLPPRNTGAAGVEPSGEVAPHSPVHSQQATPVLARVAPQSPARPASAVPRLAPVFVPVPQRLVPAPRRFDPAPARGAGLVTPAAPPGETVINIAIGRIEIRAPATAGPASPPASRRAGSRPQSLDDYLRARETAR